MPKLEDNGSLTKGRDFEAASQCKFMYRATQRHKASQNTILSSNPSAVVSFIKITGTNSSAFCWWKFTQAFQIASTPYPKLMRHPRIVSSHTMCGARKAVPKLKTLAQVWRELIEDVNSTKRLEKQCLVVVVTKYYWQNIYLSSFLTIIRISIPPPWDEWNQAFK